MQQFYDEKTLATSEPYRKSFNNDAFDLFRLHYPEHFEITGRAYRIIYKDRQKTQKSIFNMLGTNYTAYTALVNLTIEDMVNSGEISNVSEIDPTTKEGYGQIINYVKSHKDFFTSILPQLGELIKTSSGRGNVAEIKAEQVLKKMFGDKAEIRHTAGLAQKEDTHGGKDRVVISNGRAFNVQIKAVKSVNQENGFYYIEYLGAKLYPNVDIMIFVKGNWCWAFQAKDENGITTLSLYGDNQGYIINQKYKKLIFKLEPTENIQNNA
jgi:hypothetical protein